MPQDSSEHFLVEQSEGVMVVTPTDPRLLTDQKDSLYALVDRMAGVPAPKKVVLSLAGVHMLDSAGIGILINFQRRVTKAGGVLKVCDLDPNVLQVIRLTRIDQVLEIHGTRAEALASFHSRRGEEGEKGSWFTKFFGGSS
jgi:anti-sigma B factor antagonist